MQETTLLQQLSQAENGEAGAIFREYLRGSVFSAFLNVIREEVDSLCGPSCRGGAYRAGSVPSSCILNKRKERVEWPRVRRKTAGGCEGVRLKSYAAQKTPGQAERLYCELWWLV